MFDRFTDRGAVQVLELAHPLGHLIDAVLDQRDAGQIGDPARAHHTRQDLILRFVERVDQFHTELVLRDDWHVLDAGFVTILAEAVERELDLGYSLDQLLTVLPLLQFVQCADGFLVGLGGISQSLDQRFIQRLRFLGHELEHAVECQRCIPLAGDDRVELDIGPVVHSVENARLAQGGHRFTETHCACDLLHAAFVLVAFVALVECKCGASFVQLFVALLVRTLANVLPNGADALSHRAVDDRAQGGNLGCVVEVVDDVENGLHNKLQLVGCSRRTGLQAVG